MEFLLQMNSTSIDCGMESAPFSYFFNTMTKQRVMGRKYENIVN